MKVVVFKKQDCGVCDRFEESLKKQIAKFGDPEKVRVEKMFMDTTDGMVLFSAANLGQIPACVFYEDDDAEIGLDEPVASWNGRANWDQLREMLKNN